MNKTSCFLGTRAGYPLQSFFAETDKKSISVAIPGATTWIVFRHITANVFLAF
jgi:hypothetical protein